MERADLQTIMIVKIQHWLQLL